MMVLLALAASMSLGGWAQEAEKPKQDGPAAERGERSRRGEGRGQGQRGDRLAQLSEALKLTDEQKGKLKPVLKAQQAKSRELRQDSALTAEERRNKSRAVRQEFTAKIKEILTKEQQEKFDKLQEQGPGRRQRQGGDGQGGGERPQRRRQQQAQ